LIIEKHFYIKASIIKYFFFCSVLIISTVLSPDG
jgi:hypothetical protein